MRIHLVDGTWELFRNHFGAPSRRDPHGREVGASVGLLRTLLSLLREDEVTHVGVAFDTVIESFRNELFAGYKTGEGLDPDLLRQFPLAERAARALGLVVWPMVELEADDALATAAARWRGVRTVEQVVICSPDKDLAQCVQGRRVVCLDRRRKALLDEGGVVARFGVLPSSIPDWLALVGDAADGIPGLPGWGKTSAARLLARYGHLDRIPRREENWEVRVPGATRLAATLWTHRADALLYRRLATLREDAPVEERLSDLRWRGARRKELLELCEELRVRRLPDRVFRWQ